MLISVAVLLVSGVPVEPSLVRVDDGFAVLIAGGVGAWAPMPGFELVLVLHEEFEDSCGALRGSGLGGVVCIPGAERRAPSLASTYLAVEAAVETVRRGGRVVVVGVDGVGGVGAVAAAYLVRRYGLGPRVAVERVRGVGPGLVGLRAEEVFVGVYARARSLLDPVEMRGVWVVGVANGWGRGEMHASYVALHSVRLFEQLAGRLGLREGDLKPLLVAALLHDVGLSRGEPHEQHSYEVIMGSGELEPLGPGKGLAALIALYHRRRGDPRGDPRCGGEAGLVARLAAILKVADAMDYSLTQPVEDVEVVERGDSLTLRLWCIDDCGLEADRVLEKAWLLEELLGKRVEVEVARGGAG